MPRRLWRKAATSATGSEAEAQKPAKISASTSLSRVTSAAFISIDASAMQQRH